MLGTIARQTVIQPVELTTKLTDTILENWKEERTGFVPTLKASENPYDIWKEFWLYASGSAKWCPRMYALSCAAGDSDSGEVLKAETLWNFDQGHSYHNLFQQKILQSLPDGIFQGSWERMDRLVDESGLPTDPTPESNDITLAVLHKVEFVNGDPVSVDGVDKIRGWGPRPEGDGWRYVESKFRMPNERIVVKLDGILAWPDQPHEVMEIKTEKIEARDLLNPKLGGKPRKAHIEQVQIGMAATGLLRARIIYVFKGALSFKGGIIEHIVERDELLIAAIRRRASECVEAVRIVEGAKDKGTATAELLVEVDEGYPRLPECPMKSKGRAKYCAGRDLCFPKGYRKKKASGASGG